LRGFKSLQLSSTQSESPLARKCRLLLNPMCVLKYVLNCKQNFSIPCYPTSIITVTGLARVYYTYPGFFFFLSLPTQGMMYYGL
jgi:hypothetical protein